MGLRTSATCTSRTLNHFKDRWHAALEASVPINTLEGDKGTKNEMSFGPFAMTEAGLFAEVRKGKETEQRWLGAPFRVLGRCRDPHSGSGGGYSASQMTTVSCTRSLLRMLTFTETVGCSSASWLTKA